MKKFEIVLILLCAVLFFVLFMTDQVGYIRSIFGVFASILILLFVLLMFIYVIGLIVSVFITYAVAKIFRTPVLEPADLSSVEFLDQKAIEEVTNTLQGKGFSLFGDFKMRLVTATESYMRVFVNQERTIEAALMHMKSTGAKGLTLEFSTTFEDGTKLVTMNTSEPSPVLYSDEWKIYRYIGYPSVTLLEKHLSHLNELAQNKIAKKLEEDFQKNFIEEWQRLLDYQVAQRILRKDSRQELYRFTFSGAFFAVKRQWFHMLRKGLQRREKSSAFGAKTIWSEALQIGFIVMVLLGGYFLFRNSSDSPSRALFLLTWLGVGAVGFFVMSRTKALKIISVFIGITVIFLFFTTLQFSGLPHQIIEEISSYPEARLWLKTNENRSALASNRFSTTYEAIEFVDRLYEAGAVLVLVYNIKDEAWLIKDVGEPYADSLIIQLPSKGEQRERIFELANEEIKQEGFPAEKDKGQEYLYLWWD